MSEATVREAISKSTDICVDGENYHLVVGFGSSVVASSRDSRLVGFNYKELDEKLSKDPDSVHFYRYKRVEIKPKKFEGGKGGREK